MKNINRKKLNDPIARIRKHPKYKEYAQDARNRIDLAIDIYNFRKQKKLSQQKLAKKATTTQKVISKIENADMNMSWDLIMRILNALELTLKIVEIEKNVTQSIEWPLLNISDYAANMRDQWETVPTESASNKQVKRVKFLATKS